MAPLLACFAATLLAEVVGDKTLYTAGALAGAHRPGPVVVGAGAAAAVKMAVAVVAGGLLASLPVWLLTSLSLITWVGMAVALWRDASGPTASSGIASGPRLAGATSAAVFFTEWGDPGQMAAALFAATNGPSVGLWLAATLAMMVKIVAGSA